MTAKRVKYPICRWRLVAIVKECRVNDFHYIVTTQKNYTSIRCLHIFKLFVVINNVFLLYVMY